MRFFCLTKQREVNVRDGVWVVQFQYGDYMDWDSSFYTPHVVHEHIRVTKYLVKVEEPCQGNGFGRIKTCIFTAGVPFAVVVTGTIMEALDGSENWQEWTAGFYPARRLVDDKPKTLPHIRRLPVFTRGAKQWRWARLTELAEIVGMPPEETFRRFFHFCETLRWSSNWIRHFMSVTLDNPRTSIVEVDENLELERADWRKGAEKVDATRVWIPAGWAMTVCLMHKYHVIPEIPVENEDDDLFSEYELCDDY